MITIMANLTMHILIICNRSLYLFILDREGLERTVVHLEIDGKHYYYRNLKDLCEQWFFVYLMRNSATLVYHLINLICARNV